RRQERHHKIQGVDQSYWISISRASERDRNYRHRGGGYSSAKREALEKGGVRLLLWPWRWMEDSSSSFHPMAPARHSFLRVGTGQPQNSGGIVAGQAPSQAGYRRSVERRPWQSRGQHLRYSRPQHSPDLATVLHRRPLWKSGGDPPNRPREPQDT